MALNDFKIIKGSAGVLRVAEQELDNGGAGANINAGEPVKIGGTGNGYGVVLADGDPEYGTDQFLGIALRSGSATTSANGFVEVEQLYPGIGQFRGAATTAANMDTSAELQLIRFNQIGVDYSAQVFTLDENQTDASTSGLQIVDGDPATSTLVVRPMVWLGGQVGNAQAAF